MSRAAAFVTLAGIALLGLAPQVGGAPPESGSALTASDIVERSRQAFYSAGEGFAEFLRRAFHEFVRPAVKNDVGQSGQKEFRFECFSGAGHARV